MDLNSMRYAATDVPKDKKFMSVLAKQNAAIITKDKNLATFAELEHLVFEIDAVASPLRSRSLRYAWVAAKIPLTFCSI